MIVGDSIIKASEIIKKGGIVIFPTDTAFGIGCDMFNVKAVEKLFFFRRRPSFQAAPVLVDSLLMAQSLFLPLPLEIKDRLITPFWPGALTIVFNCKTGKVPPLVRGYGKTLGVRMPNNKTILFLIKASGVPILGPSANFHGDKTPFVFDDINKNLMRLADYTLTGKCLLKQPSTVVDCTKKPWEILRQGAVNSNLSL